MVRYLIDTNVLSELRKGSRADTSVTRWFESLPDDAIFISVLTVGEIRRGIENIRRRDVPAAAALETWLQRVLSGYSDRILPVERNVAEEWGRMNVPDPIPVVDGLLAATAKVHGLTVATRNVNDLANSGVPLFNPFEAAPKPPTKRRLR
jgi:predicted nucleic acid-binding protein